MSRRIETVAALLVLSALCACGGTPGGPAASEEAVELLAEGEREATAGKPRIALRKFDAAIADSPRFHLAYARRAFSHETLGNFEKALADHATALQHALEINKAQYHLNRAQFFVRRKRFEEAERDFTTAVERQKDWPHPSYFPFFWLQRASFYLNTEKYDECIADAEYVLGLHPDETTAKEARQLIADARSKKP